MSPPTAQTKIVSCEQSGIIHVFSLSIPADGDGIVTKMTASKLRQRSEMGRNGGGFLSAVAGCSSAEREVCERSAVRTKMMERRRMGMVGI